MIKDTATLFKGLSDETRLRIIALLLAQGEGGELCVCDLTATLQLPQSTVSRHLAYLRKCGLVRDRRDGLWMYYSIVRQRGLQESLLQLLCATLPGLPEAVEDLRRLQATAECNRCA